MCLQMVFRSAAAWVIVCGTLLFTSCQTYVPPVEFEHPKFECTTQLSARETKEMLDELELIQTQLYAFLGLKQQKPDIKPVINIFTSRTRYYKKAEAFGVPGLYTDGFCDVDKLELNILLKPSVFGGYKNRSTLYHEFTHLALSHKMIYATSRESKQRFPFWFAEGIATYVETVEFAGDQVMLGAVNDKRLKLLKPYLDQEIVQIAPIINRDYDQGFSQNHYAVAWGLTYYILSTTELRDQMQLFINEFPRKEHGDSFKAFKQYFLQNSENYALWETAFINYINQL